VLPPGRYIKRRDEAEYGGYQKKRMVLESLGVTGIQASKLDLTSRVTGLQCN
jgi:hypothetical protein